MEMLTIHGHVLKFTPFSLDTIFWNEAHVLSHKMFNPGVFSQHFLFCSCVKLHKSMWNSGALNFLPPHVQDCAVPSHHNIKDVILWCLPFFHYPISHQVSVNSVPTCVLCFIHFSQFSLHYPSSRRHLSWPAVAAPTGPPILFLSSVILYTR